MRLSAEKPDWWPKNPYPKNIFTMTIEEYVLAVPDKTLRTAISGCLGRYFWEMVSEDIWEKWQNYLKEKGE